MRKNYSDHILCASMAEVLKYSNGNGARATRAKLLKIGKLARYCQRAMLGN